MKQIATFGLIFGLFAGIAASAEASTISWAGATLAGTGTSSILTTGNLLAAHNVGDPTATAAGGVTFDALVSNPFGNVFTGADATSLTGSSAFDSVLNSASYGKNSSLLTLTGLTNGDSYLVQLFVADTRTTVCSPNCNTRTVTVTAGTSLTSLGLGLGWVFNGTFVADAITQDITFTGSAPENFTYLNAFQVRNTTLSATQNIAAVPEPATLALLGVGLVGLGIRLRRK